MQTVLSERQRQILSGEAGLDAYKVERYRTLWSSQGYDLSEFLPACLNRTKDNLCGLAAIIAKTPVNNARVGLQCYRCDQTPDCDAVKELVQIAVESFRGPSKPAAAAKPKPRPQIDEGMDEETAFQRFPCVYREKTDQQHQCKSCGGGGRTHTLCDCRLFNRQCTVRVAADAKDPNDGKRVEACLTCEKREAPIVPKMDYLRRADGTTPVDLAHLYAGGTCILVCGGPSVREMDLTPIHQRGITIAAINNAGAAVVRPHLWFSMDAMKKFHPSILHDPAVMCFLNLDHLDNRLRIQSGEEWTTLDRVRTCPNVFAYRVQGETHINTRQFMSGPLSYRMENPGGGYRSATMPLALRILLDLGFKRIGIIGADFHMGADRQYAWDEEKDQKAQNTNNTLYATMNDLFEKIRPGVEQQGRRIVNCTPGGEMKGWPRQSLEEFCTESLKGFPAFVSAKGYYVDPKR